MKNEYVLDPIERKTSIYVEYSTGSIDISHKLDNRLKLSWYTSNNNVRRNNAKTSANRIVAVPESLKATHKVMRMLRNQESMNRNVAVSILLLDASLDELKKLDARLRRGDLSYREMLYAYRLLRDLSVLISAFLESNSLNIPYSIRSRLDSLKERTKHLFNEVRKNIP